MWKNLLYALLFGYVSLVGAEPVCPPGNSEAVVAQKACCAGSGGVCGCRGERVVCCNGSLGACPCRAPGAAERVSAQPLPAVALAPTPLE